MRLWVSGGFAMLSVFAFAASMGEPAFAQGAGGNVTACAQFVTVLQFGETEFEFQHRNFQRCSELVPPGIPLVDANAMPHPRTGDAYTVTCQCAKESSANGSRRQ